MRKLLFILFFIPIIVSSQTIDGTTYRPLGANLNILGEFRARDGRIIQEIIEVAKEGGNYTSLLTAISSISDASAVKPYEVVVYSGVYVEAPITIPSFVKVCLKNAILSPSNTSADFITLEVNSILDGGIVLCPSSGNGIVPDSINCTVSNCQIQNGQTGVYALDSNQIFINNCDFINLTNAIFSDSADIDFQGVKAINCTNFFRLDNTASIRGTGFNSESGTTFDILQEDATSTIQLSGGFISSDKLSVTDFSNVQATYNYERLNDEAFVVINELNVGVPEKGKESVMGQGDSYVRGMLVYSFDGTATYKNLSDSAASPTNSEFSFPNFNVGTIIYIASSLNNTTDLLKHSGIKVATETARVGGTIVTEYWDGGSWTAFNTFTSDADWPYDSHADSLFFETVNTQIRYDQNMIDDNWTKNDPPSLGTNYYWARFRITVQLTTAPIFEQFKLHTDRTEINADGVMEFFGRARPKKPLLVHQRLTDDLLGASPGNVAINFSTNITITPIDNNYANNSLDGNGLIITIPDGLDTSIPIEFDALWIPSANGAGNVELQVDFASINVGDVLDGTISDSPLTEIIALNAQIDELQKTTFIIDVSDLRPDDELVISHYRDARAGNLDDTFVGAVEIVGFNASGIFWK